MTDVTQEDRDRAADFMSECAPYLGDCGMKNSVELALQETLAHHRIDQDTGELQRLRHALQLAASRLHWAATANPGVSSDKGAKLVLSWEQEALATIASEQIMSRQELRRRREDRLKAEGSV